MRRTVSRGSFRFDLPLMVTAGYRALSHANNETATPRPSRFPTLKQVRNLDALLEIKRAEHNLPAVTALTLSDGAIAAKGETGLRKTGTSVVVRPGDRWHIGGCAKAMTATLIGALVEEGALTWETTIGAALPTLKNSILPAYHNVTLEMLLTHRAGIPKGYEAPDAWRYTWKREGTPVQHRHKVSALMLRNAPLHTPGKSYAYSTMGYCIAGHMAEKITGYPWESLIQDLVFEPLGMNSAGPGPEQNCQQIASPWGHQREGTPIEPGVCADQPAAFSPGGGSLHISMTDWSKFVAEHLKGAKGENGQLLSADTYARLHSWQPTRPHSDSSPSNHLQSVKNSDGYAMGWQVCQRHWANNHPNETGTCLSHHGTILSWHSQVLMAPERNMAVLCATNIGDRNRGHAVSISEKLNDVAWAVIKEALAAQPAV
ncbi:MAG: serine hydrolase domain-containing protein [Cyanobacteria bacterium J06598_1]